MSDFPPVPLTLEGASVLHQFFRFDWKAWRACAAGEREKIAGEAVAAFQAVESDAQGKVQTAIYSELGHKGDLIFVHFRDSLEALNRLSSPWRKLRSTIS